MAVSLPAIPFVLENEIPSLEYYGEIGCAHCDLFAEKLLPSAVEQSGVEVKPSYYDILSADGYARCENELSKRGQEFKIFPVMIIGNNVYQGNDAVERNLLLELEYFSKHNGYMPEKSADIGRVKDLIDTGLIGVVFAGLIDGINPCAFATMLFFISWITIRGGGRRKILLSGAAFIAGVYLTYLVIGFGLFKVLRQAAGFFILRTAMRWGFGFSAALFALLSLIDAFSVLRGKPEKVMLQLSKRSKLLIHKVIRLGRVHEKRALSLLLLPGLLLAGVIVAFLELACTGQIYFPTIAYMVQTAQKPGAEILLLQLYNAAFIIPLLIILLLAAAGVEQKGIQLWFSRNLFAGKLITAVFFLLLAFLIFGGGFNPLSV